MLSKAELEAWVEKNFPEIEYNGIHKGHYRYGDDRWVDERIEVRSALEDLIEFITE